jgi:hypothetical protein
LAETVKFRSGEGKIRSFWGGFGLALVTFGIYYYFWFYKVNNELKLVGESYSDPELSESKPGNSLLAVLIGGFLLLPPYISVYRYGKRIRHAEGVVGIPESERINPVTAFLLLFPGGILIIPVFFHYAMVTRHQNAVETAAAAVGRPASPAPEMAII